MTGLPLIVLSAVLMSQGGPKPEEIDEVLNDVCGYALDAQDSVSTLGQQKGYELYVGRMETRMMHRQMSEDDKEAMRLLCTAYLFGAVKEANIVLKMIPKDSREGAPARK